MSIFGDIMSAIFGHSASAAPAGSGPQVEPPPTGSAPQVQPAPTSATAKLATQATVDVAAVLDGLAKQKKQKLKWRTSIVDLMKLLDLDSSAAARKREERENCSQTSCVHHGITMVPGCAATWERPIYPRRPCVALPIA